jgi:deoxyadenosine/deoxycytidine kinase
MYMAPLIVAIDGLMGSGKTTLLQNLAKRGFSVIPEQSHSWKFISKFYENPKKYALTFQTEVLLTFNDYAFKDDGIVFVERCPQVTRSVFGKLLVSDGILTDEEMATFNNIYDLLHIWEPDVHIFISCPADIALERFKSREEAYDITPEYMKKLQSSYDIFNRYVGAIVVDGTQPEEDVVYSVLTNASLIERCVRRVV